MQQKKKGVFISDRAVSEAIGFIIIFGIIIGGVGIVTLYGYPMLTQRQTSADEQIMEKNMIVLQNDLKSIAYKTIPYTETSLKVGSGSLTVYNMTYNNATESNFSVYDSEGLIASAANPLLFSSGDLRYESINAETGLSLENGAVVKRMIAENGSAMLANPRWYYDSQTNTAVIYLIGFSASDIMAQTGVGTVKMNLGQTNYMSYVLPAGDMLYVRYLPNNNADYSAAWGNYFAGMNLAATGAPGEYLWPLNTTEPANVVIYQYQVNIESV
ncbi:DUF7289 family protein [Methanoregula sp.]|uniref:DUF7289 family protein n=1 Tax=Methanoregula sp. TaxID=2052170 RepID=UPI002CAE44A2|nr:hypothetical protein [Methanoregula sp.]HVP96457.1 hypothetical protein [Methanoregula sp.]